MEIQNVTGPDVMKNTFSVVPQREPETEERPREPQKVENENKGFSVDTYA